MSHNLVVEDSRLSWRMIVDTSREDGHTVVEAKNGEEGLKEFTQERPDSIVTELLMPIKQGEASWNRSVKPTRMCQSALRHPTSSDRPDPSAKNWGSKASLKNQLQQQLSERA